jgi:hypothetical protein
MTFEQIESEFLTLSKNSQAALLARLLEHLGRTLEIDQEVAELWVDEAEVRDEAMNQGQTSGIPAKELFQRIRSSIK